MLGKFVKGKFGERRSPPPDREDGVGEATAGVEMATTATRILRLRRFLSIDSFVSAVSTVSTVSTASSAQSTPSSPSSSLPTCIPGEELPSSGGADSSDDWSCRDPITPADLESSAPSGPTSISGRPAAAIGLPVGGSEGETSGAEKKREEYTYALSPLCPALLCAATSILPSYIDAGLDFFTATSTILAHPTSPPPIKAILVNVGGTIDRIIRHATVIIAIVCIGANWLLAFHPCCKAGFFIPPLAKATLQFYPRRHKLRTLPPVPVTNWNMLGVYTLHNWVEMTRFARHAAYGLSHLTVALGIRVLAGLVNHLERCWVAPSLPTPATLPPNTPPTITAILSSAVPTLPPPTSISSPTPHEILQSYDAHISKKANDLALNQYHLGVHDRVARRWRFVGKIPGGKAWIYWLDRGKTCEILGLSGRLDPNTPEAELAKEARMAPVLLDAWWEQQRAEAVKVLKREHEEWDAVVGVPVEEDEMPESWVAPVWEF
ncbi:hypothetical protein CcaverHIS002_0411420 [Cutaneotrichosporon cavernicola]|uniref:Uncharacterized protein n=1 Tax=Cutaneotrichosporon cavernicola TaxID=279322 RepID=A0AA48L5E6_9TREE|nr:uncharacterized protein CcaverHIS019_0411340 [Cutaneotrichosporon cavernicola]BEI84538.1 hypothetical protein CcaverHIS002_0411420 [Cutaneotrichosporon cavernicola]BEI92314.1 hypothetical protein CcaverHIS019_0411340 [Cutaneotrichosporon cavernicola]BEJ00084.1 hypothetical protein CcaverHIS631_0411260 [Cutaneotrichosporon cavernicola]BEJ07856.1 hypothetical protein CcaverHIS641_0411250 [Cutaneotrichosporon cavernicola]